MTKALSNGGWLLALAVALLALAVAAWLANPVEEAADHVVAPVAREAGILPSRCPSGWKDTTERDEHTRVFSCLKDDWLVILDQDGKFQHAVQLDTPGANFVFDSTQVPGW